MERQNICNRKTNGEKEIDDTPFLRAGSQATATPGTVCK